MGSGSVLVCHWWKTNLSVMSHVISSLVVAVVECQKSSRFGYVQTFFDFDAVAPVYEIRPSTGFFSWLGNVHRISDGRISKVLLYGEMTIGKWATSSSLKGCLKKGHDGDRHGHHDGDAFYTKGWGEGLPPVRSVLIGKKTTRRHR